MANALSKAELASELAARNGLTKKAGVEILDTLASLAYRHIKHTFTLPGIGKFVLVARKARMGRNPKTSQPVPIPARKVVRFRAAKAFKESMLAAR
jgi:DNA-binding protein HU-beta